MALDKDYCFTCKKEVDALPGGHCPRCMKVLWTATATKPAEYIHTLRTKSYATEDLLRPRLHEEPLKREEPWKKPAKNKKAFR